MTPDVMDGPPGRWEAGDMPDPPATAEARGAGLADSPEVALSLAAVTGGTVAAVLAGLVGWLLAGPADGVAAAVGAGLPAVLALASIPFLLVGALLGRGSGVAGASLVALSFRLVLAFALLVLLARHTSLSFTPLGLGLAAGLVGSIGAEMRRTIRDPRLLAIDAEAAATRAEQTARWRAVQDDGAGETLLRRSAGPAYLPPQRHRR